MIAKCLVAAATLLASSPAVPQTMGAPTVPRIMCKVPRGYTAGSAFRIGSHFLVTAKHVIANGECRIDGEPVTITYKSPAQDYALLSDDRDGAFLKVDCGGFQRGHEYIAIGHARGLDQLTAIKIIGTGEKDGDMSILVGIFTVIPGQSGGVILDAETGAAVGMVNAYDPEKGWSYSIALHDTSICEGRK